MFGSLIDVDIPAECYMLEENAFNSIYLRLLELSLCLAVELIEFGSTLCENKEKCYLPLGSTLSLVLIKEPLFLLIEGAS